MAAVPEDLTAGDSSNRIVRQVQLLYKNINPSAPCGMIAGS
jgi:hypothetical protein